MDKRKHNSDVDVVAITLLWRPQSQIANDPHAGRSFSSSVLTIRCITVLNEPKDRSSSGKIIVESDRDDRLTLWSGGNLGYGGGNNVGVEWARRSWSPRYFLVLNPDVTIEVAAVEKLVAMADASPRIAILGPIQQVQQGDELVLRRGMRYLKPLSILKSVNDPKSRIDYLNGGALLIRSSALSGELPFTEGYFLFFEEIEISERLRRRGYMVAPCEASCVVHKEAGSRGSRYDDDYIPEVAEYFENLNALRFTRKNFPWWVPLVFIFRVTAKPLVLILRGDTIRFRFWALSIKDFLLFRVRRFPFQNGWSPALPTESIMDVPWPRFARVGGKSRIQR